MDMFYKIGLTVFLIGISLIAIFGVIHFATDDDNSFYIIFALACILLADAITMMLRYGLTEIWGT